MLKFQKSKKIIKKIILVCKNNQETREWLQIEKLHHYRKITLTILLKKTKNQLIILILAMKIK